MINSSRRAAQLEPLESRRLLAAAAGAVLAPDGTLTVTGTAGNDTIELLYSNEAVVVNGQRFEFIDSNVLISRTVVNALDGDDSVTLDEVYARGTPVSVDLGAGNDTAILYGTAVVAGGKGDDLVKASQQGYLTAFSDKGGIDTLDLSDHWLAESLAVVDMRTYPGLDNVIVIASDVIGNDLDNRIELLDYFEGHTAYGNGGNDTCIGGQFSDHFVGGAGSDTFVDRWGTYGETIEDAKDTFVGGAGSDTLDYSERTSDQPSVIDLAAGIAGVTGEVDALTGVENAIGGSGDDTLIGDGNRNILDGRAGNDTLTGNGGKDILIGGEGNDTFYAQDGKRDKIFGDAGTDSAQRDKKDWLSEIETLI